MKNICEVSVGLQKNSQYFPQQGEINLYIDKATSFVLFFS